MTKTNEFEMRESFVIVGNGAEPIPKALIGLLQADMQRGVDEMNHIVSSAIYRSERELFASYRTRPLWIQRAFWRVRGYTVTLWEGDHWN